MATTYSSRTTNPIGGSQVAGGGLWYNLPIDGFNKRDAWAIFNDFETFGQFDATNDWAITAVNTPGGGNVTFALVNSATTTFSTHGVLGAVTGTTVSSGYTVQALGSGTLNGQGITPIAGRSCAFEIKVGTTTATGWTDCSWFFGLCAATASSTIPISNVGALTASSTGLAGFHHLSTSATGIPSFVAAGTNSTVVTVAPTVSKAIPAGVQSTTTVDGFRRFGLRFDAANRVTWYIDGVAMAATVLASSYANNTPLFPSFSVMTKSASATSTAWRIDYVALGATR